MPFPFPLLFHEHVCDGTSPPNAAVATGAALWGGKVAVNRVGGGLGGGSGQGYGRVQTMLRTYYEPVYEPITNLFTNLLRTWRLAGALLERPVAPAQKHRPTKSPYSFDQKYINNMCHIVLIKNI